MISRSHSALNQCLLVQPQLPTLKLPSHKFFISISILGNQNPSRKKLHESRVALNILFCFELGSTDLDFREAYIIYRFLIIESGSHH